MSWILFRQNNSNPGDIKGAPGQTGEKVRAQRILPRPRPFLLPSTLFNLRS
jgi:hypothetical protein